MYPTYRFCNKYAEPLAASQGVRSAISEKKSPKSLSSAAPALSTMSAQVLAQHCIKEIGNYRKGEPSDEQFALELFRRATVQGSQDAWLWLQQCFGEIVLGWIRCHPRREAAYRYDSEENYVARAFERFWQATTLNQKLEFSSLGAALQYLRASLNAAIVDTLRVYSRPRETQLPEPGSPGEPLVEEAVDSNELWELLLGMFPNQQEQRLMYLLYHCGLKPREIMYHCPQEFGDVQHIYRLRRSMMERLLRNVDQLRWRLGVDTKDC